MTKKELLNMGLHEVQSVGNNTTVFRVINGWIYETKHNHSDTYGGKVFKGVSICFVPDNGSK